MDFYRERYPDVSSINIEYEPFGKRLRSIRKEKGMTQEEFAALLGTSKQVLSRYEIGQRIPKITQVQQYANRLNVSVDYLMGDSEAEAAFNSLCPADHLPFYKIFADIIEGQLGLDIPGVTRITGLTDWQIKTIIIRQLKTVPLSIALRLSDTLGVPIKVWAGVQPYVPQDISVEAREVARAYEQATLKNKNIARLSLNLEPVRATENAIDGHRI